MAKIAVLAIIGNPNSGATRGVYDKVSAQVAALHKIGWDVRGMLGVSGSDPLPGDTSHIVRLPYHATTNRFKRRPDFFRAALDELTRFSPDVVYIRYPLSDWTFLRFLIRLRKHIPGVRILVERQTMELGELLVSRSLGNLFKWASEALFRVPVQRQIDFNIGVTQEICDYISGYYPPSQCIPCGNGVPSNRVPDRVPEFKHKEDVLRLVFIGNITPWCGMELLIDQLRALDFRYEGRDVALDIVGDGVFLKNLKDSAQDLESVVFHGFLSGAALDDRLSAADIAIGALNNQKRLLKEGSNLKLRLYCAQGVPFVLTEKDTDFSNAPEAASFFLDGTAHAGVNAALVREILEFAAQRRADPEKSEAMRLFARDHLTWERKLEKILARVEPNGTQGLAE